jgi:OFA family oxalate/formate antiporter-like MFS transporter
LNALLAFSIPYVASIKEIYFVYIVLTYICYGGHLGIFPAITSLVFGVRYGPQIYGILFYAFPVSNFIQFMLVNYVDSDYMTIFKISGVMSICALVIVKKL